MRFLYEYVAMACCVAALGCANNFEEVHEVKGLRVLAVSADPPEIAPGEGATVRVLWADPQGKGRTVDFVWWVCAGFVSGADLEMCEMMMPPIRMSSEEGGDTLAIPETPNDILDGAILPAGMNSFMVTFVGLVCAGGTLPGEKKLSNPKQVAHIDDYCKGGDAISFFRTVTISDAQNPQRNPGIDRVMFKGEPLAPLSEDPDGRIVRCKEKEGCGAQVRLKLFMTEGSEQSYEVTEFGKPTEYEEVLFVSWYVTGGGFKDGYRSVVDEEKSTDPLGPFETVWEPEEPGKYTLYAAAHDVRGGVSFETYAFEVEPPK